VTLHPAWTDPHSDHAKELTWITRPHPTLPRLATAIDTAHSLLHEYQALALYNSALSASVGTLEGTFHD